MEERKTLFHTYVKYESMPERKYLRPWIRSSFFLLLHAATTAVIVVTLLNLMGVE